MNDDATNVAATDLANAGGLGTDANANHAANAAAPVPTEGKTDDVNQRLLRESQTHKARAIAAERELETLRKSKAEEQGQFKELYEKEKKSREELHRKVVWSEIRTAVSSVAAKSGCVNPDALLKLGDLKLLQYDENDGSVAGAELFVEESKKLHPYLFQTQRTVTVNGATPSDPAPKTINAADIAKMTPQEKSKYWAQAIGR